MSADVNSSASVSPLIGIYDRLQANADPRRPCLLGQRLLTYGQLFDRVARLAAFYGKLRLAYGDRVVILTKSDADLVTLTVSLLRTGFCQVVLSPELAEDELRRILAAADPSLIVADVDIVARMAATLPSQLPVVEIADEIRRLTGDDVSSRGRAQPGRYMLHELLQTVPPAAKLPADIPETTTFSIAFTSGTTSKPKGVENTHRSYGWQLQKALAHYMFTAETRVVLTTSFYHLYARAFVNMVLFSGGTSVMAPMKTPHDAHAVLEAATTYGATHLAATPKIIEMILTYGSGRLDCFRSDWFEYVICGTDRLPTELWIECERRLGRDVVVFFGATESPGIAVCGPQPDTRKVGTLGKPIGCEIRILDEHGNPVRSGEVGELVVHSQSTMKGYFRLPDATAAVLREGWYFTGDLVSEDEGGFLQYRGRKREMIICGGFNIFPDDIARVLTSMPGVAEAIAFGVEDPVFGQIPVACVVPNPGKALSEATVADHFLSHASPRLLPRRIHVLHQLPRTDSGKVAIAELRTALGGRAREDPIGSRETAADEPVIRH